MSLFGASKFMTTLQKAACYYTVFSSTKDFI